MSSSSNPVEMFPRTRQESLHPPGSLIDLLPTPLTRLRFTDGHVGWLVTGYELARSVISDRRLGLHGPMRSPIAHPEKSPAILEALGPLKEGFLLELDPPEHTLLRRSVAEHFSRSRIAQLRPKIEEVVNARLMSIAEMGPPADLVSTFALPIPSFVMCDLMGIPREDRQQFEVPTSLMLDGDASPEATADAVLAFRAYVDGVLEAKRREPGDDLISRLLAEGTLDDDRLAGMAMFLFIAGHETTASTIALGTYTLIEHPDWSRILRKQPDLMDGAVEELLRFSSVVESAGRVALEDVTLGEERISEGDSILISLNVANRDPGAFDRPSIFDPTRSGRRHIAFGHGIHICLGQHLARLEVSVALSALLQRFPDLRLASGVAPVRVESTDQLVSHIGELPVAW